ncbi:translational GTPase TypA [Lactobacillus delbrueckii subsp. bulgaricus]|uniref:translational GTPase TypA n=1 Tax=Lactobacillus delbrueckii TaxID=1584 RepID=UPI000761F74E|nr:translational GTPase TypA [Lactobacillus delbrueckii]MBT8802846.1 GTP-binding protein TypA [Lactobacillus delbrueckii subsp. bulgaricus]MBT8807340.1 GTP-binding protein TypA [Lactobacillus delbrueckii subsp. bulgaricus]MBT8810539.1 GTP-binding protein TypA [Lactobacillus delbrueckii subsp. bulgaricus]MBT8817199.1 GTP-binding protein TypA [Lactobacillus delbrueckii subsp. bulgaricus]MBT8828363.1 GTP-binding protein TypA [Lactobacillus delbrueckii subsp. bulgaricus]
MRNGEETFLADQKRRENIRNIAIIAHVDHGKTTLVNQLLKQSDTLPEHMNLEDRAMDSNAIERERGITILSKNTAVSYKGTTINILDTPGHADFGGEVERIMHMVDGALLLVDAYEGPMPQTRFVLQKALEAGVKPVVVVNKIDRPGARPAEVLDEVLELFIELGANDEQLEFPVVYASALNGTSSCSDDPADQEETMDPVFDTVIKAIPAPLDNEDEPLQFQITMLDWDDYVGRIGVGRVYRGKIKVGDEVTVMKLDGSKQNFRVTKLFGYFGLKRNEIKEAKAGDIIAISGINDIFVGETIASKEKPEALPILRIDPPTLQMDFVANDSPFAGREGSQVTPAKLEERLLRQTRTDVSLKVEPTDQLNAWTVSGRGELHLSILVEEMRREGFELQLSRPKVIYREVDGQMCEPYEAVQVDVPDEYVGSVIDGLSQRKGEMQNMVSKGNGQTRLEFSVPSRGLIGYNNEFMSATGGYGIMNHTFSEYKPVVKNWNPGRRNGALVSINQGQSTTYSLQSVEQRGQLFIGAGVQVYEGMIVGVSSRDRDIAVNVTKGKNLTNTRASGKDHAAAIRTPKTLTLEESIEFLNDDEYCEVTPESLRLRKKILNTSERQKFDKKKAKTN